MSRQKLPLSGFRRGFLFSDGIKKQERLSSRKEESSASFNNPPPPNHDGPSSQQDPILQQQQHNQSSASSKTRTRSRDLLFLEDENAAVSLTTESTKKNPLLVVMEEGVVGDFDADASADDNDDPRGGIKSIASSSPPLIERMELVDEDTLLHASSTSTDVKEEQRTSNHHENHPLRDVTSVPVLQSDLANIFYRLRRVVAKTNTTTASNQRKRMAPIVEPFLQTHRGDRPRRLVWESLLDALALQQQQQRRRHWNPQSSPEVGLGLYMMMTVTTAIPAEDNNDVAAVDSPSSLPEDVVQAAAAAAASTIDPAFVAFLREATISPHHHDDGDEGKTTRSRLLVAVNLLDVWLMSNDDVENEDNLLSSLVDQLVPLLAFSVTNASSKNEPPVHHSGNKPTVLANRTIDVVYRIVTEAAQRAVGGGQNAAMSALEDGNASVSRKTASAQLLAASVWRQAEAVDALWDWQLAWLLQRSPTTNKTTTIETTEGEDDDHRYQDCWNWSRFSSSKEIQRRCQAAVLVDWHQQYRNFCEQMETLQQQQQQQRHNGVDTTDSAMEEANVPLDWCRCLNGGEAVLLQNSSVESVAGGSLSQTLSSSLAPASKEQVMGMFVQYDALAVATEERNGSKTACSIAVRTLVAWIGQKRKHLGLLDRAEIEKLSGWCMERVASGKFHCMDIVVAALQALWSTSGGIPPSVDAFAVPSNGNGDVPSSFGLVVDMVESCDRLSNSSALAFETKFLCPLAANCILVLGVPAAKLLVVRVGVTRGTVEILAEVLMKHTSETCRKDGYESLLDFSCRTLLEGFHSSSWVRAKLKDQSDIFARCRLDVVMPLILRTRQELDELQFASGEKVLMENLVSVLTRNHAENIPWLVRLVVQNLRSTLPQRSQSKAESTKEFERLCTLVGQLWRNSLLASSTASENAFSDVLVAVGREFLAAPSELDSLILFGSIIGQGFNVGAVDDSRFGRAGIVILRLALDSMVDGPRTVEPPTNSIFHRIAPLLLLRRIPVSFFRLTLKEASDSSTNELFSLVVSVGQQLASRLDVFSMSMSREPHARLVSKEERRLAAEVAGQLLPLGSLWVGNKRIKVAEDCTCLELICLPVFSNLRQCLCGEREASKVTQSAVRSARAALFVVCTALQFAHEKDAGDSLLRAAFFALMFLSIEATGLAKDVVEDFVQLQTGCVEFFTLCQQLTLKSRSVAKDSQSDCCDVRSAADEISEAVRTMLQSGKPTVQWLSDPAVENHDDVGLSKSARKSLWRSLVAVSQRSDGVAASLYYLPWIFSWLTDETEDKYCTQPFCVAAAMQIVFVLLMTTKSFAFLGDSQAQQGKSVLKLYQFVIGHIAADTSSERDVGAVLARRSAALTLLLALVSVDAISTQGPSVCTHLSPVDCMKALRIVEHLAANDPDPNVQRLSHQVLSVLRPQTRE